MSGGELIREARKRAGLTQSQLAHRLDSHQSVVARWEKGGAGPDLATVQRVVRAAGFELGVALYPFDDHDLALIRRELKLLPDQRLSAMVRAVRALNRMSAIARV